MAVTVAVLGGFGLMAEAALHDLAKSPSVSQILALDRELARSRRVLARIPNRRKIRAVAADLAQTAVAARALAGVRVVLNCAWYEWNLKAMDLALALRAHYVDLGGLYHTTLRQLQRDGEFKRAGRLAALGCGSAPGITNMMAERLARDFERIDSVVIYDASVDPEQDQGSFLPPFSIRTMLDEHLLPAPVWEGGRLGRAPAHSRVETLAFPDPIGRCQAGTVIHSELATLPAYLKAKGLRDLAFKIAYPDAVRTQLGVLVAMGLHQNRPLRIGACAVSPRAFLTALAQRGALRLPPRPRDFEVLRVRVAGRADGAPLARELDCELRPDGLLSAGAAGVGYGASIATLMIAEGALVRRSGVAAPESALEPRRFFAALAARKVFRLVERTERPLRDGAAARRPAMPSCRSPHERCSR